MPPWPVGSVVLQLGLSSQNRPQDNDQSQGRFLVRSSRFLDPAVYPQGTLVTVVGPVKGVETRPIGQMAYRYPVMDVIEIKKWQPAVDSSSAGVLNNIRIQVLQRAFR